ncbi:PKD domain-containing protein [candidate division WOR-3 bacterium]|nr:PKD domain-containing protein [candidate division WOR-3 bacterium]
MHTKKFLALAMFAVILATAGCNLFGRVGVPNKPAKPNGPDMRGIGIIGVYSAKTTDPDGDSISYQFKYGSAASDTSAWSVFVPSGDSVLISIFWNAAGTYSVVARAKDTKGNVSDWSAALVVTVRANQDPVTPAIPTGPISGVKGRTYYFSATTTDPDGDAVQFRFYWGNGDTSDWGVPVPSGALDSASYSWAQGGVYYVSVQAQDKLGGVSDWSEPLGFVVTDTAYPYTIALTWGEYPRDLDSHIWTPEIEGDSWHVYFGRKGYSHIAPYCSLDVDDVTSYGPEHITITQAFPGEYIYAVHQWSSDSTITGSGAVVRIYQYGNLIRTYNVPTEPANNRMWWHVFKLNAVNGTITDLNTIETDPPLPWTMDERK